MLSLLLSKASRMRFRLSTSCSFAFKSRSEALRALSFSWATFDSLRCIFSRVSYSVRNCSFSILMSSTAAITPAASPSRLLSCDMALFNCCSFSPNSFVIASMRIVNRCSSWSWVSKALIDDRLLNFSWSWTLFAFSTSRDACNC